MSVLDTIESLYCPDIFLMQLQVGLMVGVKDTCGRVYHAKVIALDAEKEKVKVRK
jgi:hypothetical protein